MGPGLRGEVRPVGNSPLFSPQGLDCQVKNSKWPFFVLAAALIIKRDLVLIPDRRGAHLQQGARAPALPGRTRIALGGREDQSQPLRSGVNPGCCSPCRSPPYRERRMCAVAFVLCCCCLRFLFIFR